jgi:hypothetical protein
MVCSRNQSIFILNESNLAESGEGEMLAQKTFIKKTRRGNVIKVVREHYLRSAICPILDKVF